MEISCLLLPQGLANPTSDLSMSAKRIANSTRPRLNRPGKKNIPGGQACKFWFRGAGLPAMGIIRLACQLGIISVEAGLPAKGNKLSGWV